MFASRGKVCCIVDLENFFIGQWRKARCVSVSVKYRIDVGLCINLNFNRINDALLVNFLKAFYLDTLLIKILDWYIAFLRAKMKIAKSK